MVTSVSSSSTTQAVGSSAMPGIAQIKTELTAALLAAGVSNASAKDSYPKGFPANVSWTDAYNMVTKRVEDKNSSTPGTLVLSEEALKKTLSATQTLKGLGVTSLARYPRGTTVQAALDQLFMDKSNGILASTLAKSNIYDLTAFPAGTTAYQAFKLVEDPVNPGKISTNRYKEYKDSYAALTSLGITSLQNFPRATSTIEAKNLLEPKADLMLSMVGVNKSIFKDPGISSLKALSLLTTLPASINQFTQLPAGTTSEGLAQQALAAKKLVAMGYDNLSAFSSMPALKGSTVTATSALEQLTKTPKPSNLPQPSSNSTERYFQSTVVTSSKSYGTPNPITSSVLTKPVSALVYPNRLPPTKIVTAGQVLAANIAYYSPKKT